MRTEDEQPGIKKRDSGRYMTRSMEATALTRLELAIMRVYEAFGRWAVELHKLNDEVARPIGFHDIVLLHCIRMRGHKPSVSELLHFQNRHDIANVQYSIKKLTKCGLVKACAGSSRKETRITLTALGTQLTDEYAEVRNEVLISLLQPTQDSGEQLAKAALTLEHLIGTYDQATQAVMNRHILGTS